jgi:hypothetical protein
MFRGFNSATGRTPDLPLPRSELTISLIGTINALEEIVIRLSAEIDSLRSHDASP